MAFKKDLISAMKRCGGIPESSMDSYVETIEQRNKFESIAREQTERSDKFEKKTREQDLLLAKAQEEIAELKAA